MSGRYVRSAILVGSIPLLREWSTDAVGLAAELGIDRAALNDPDIPVPAGPVLRFYDQAAQRSGCASFGLRMAARTGLAVIGPLWLLVRQARTVGEMLDVLSVNFELYTQAAFTRLTDAGDGCRRLSWSSVSGVAESEVQMAEFAVAVLCAEVRRHAPARWEPLEVRFRHAPPGDRSDLRRVLGPNLQFNQPDNSILLDRALLERPLSTDGSRTRVLLGHMLRQEQDSDPGLVERVDGLVRAMLPYASCTLADIGRALGMAPRTLQEHLQAQGRSFQDIRDTVRADLARKYLKHSSLSLAQIAEILGYSEPSAFSRSFRRWHGVSARSVRAQGKTA